MDIVQLFRDQVFPQLYVQRLKRALGNTAHVYGAPPGREPVLGQSMRQKGKKNYTYIDKFEYRVDIKFYSLNFKADFDDTYFLEYK